MKLCTFGEGLCRTHITWEELEENLKTVFEDSAVFGPNKSVTPIGDGRGFMSKMCLVEPDWQNELNLAPKKFVVKICTQIMTLEAAEKMNMPADSPYLKEEFMEKHAPSLRKMNNNEITFYTNLKPYQKKEMAIPKVFFTKSFSETNPCKGYIVMQYFEGAEKISVYDNMTVEQMKQPLRTLAMLEAAGMNYTEEEKNSYVVDVLALFGKSCTPQATSALIDMLNKRMREYFPEKIDTLEKIMPDVLDFSFVTSMNENLGMNAVSIHGDLWSNNMIWKRNEDGSLKLEAIVDFQTSGFGNPATDICRLLNSSLSAKDRKQHDERLIDTFYGYLEEEIKGHEMPYTREQLHESVKRYKPIGSVLVVHGLLPLFDMHSKNMDEEQKEKAMNRIIEKTEGLIDDIIEYHARNQEIIQEIKNNALENRSVISKIK